MDELVRRLVANPNDQTALGAAYQEGQADPRGYAAILERVGDMTSDTTFAAHWLSEAAHVWSTTLGDARRAATLLMRAIEKDPASDTASDRLATLYRDKGDHRALVALYERRAKALAQNANGDPGVVQRVSMLHEEAARLWQDPPLSQPRKAVENYKRAFEIDPSAVTAIYAARELLKAEGNFKEAIPLFDLEIRAIDDHDRKLALLRDEATVRTNHGDAKGASQALRTALRLDPHDSGLQYELATSVVSRIQANENVPDNERGEAAELLVTMAQQYDGEHALAYSEAALDAQPGHERAMQLVLHWSQQLGREDGMEQRWAGYLKANPSGTMAGDGRKHLARSLEAQGKLEDAIKVLEPMKNDPDPSVMMRLGELYAKTGKTTELAAHMDRHAASLPPAERLQKQLEIASLLAQKNDKKGALAKYREVLEADAAHPEALSFVEDSLRASRQYKELREVLLNAARVSAASIESRRVQLREVANLSETQLKDQEGAINAYRQLLSLDRTDESARAAMQRLLEKNQRWDDLAALYEQEANGAADVEERISLEKRLADLHEKKRGDKREAAEALLRVVANAPKDEESLSRAINLFSAVDDFQRAASAIDENVGALDPGPTKGQLLLRLGELRDRLGDLPGSAESYAEAGEILHDAEAWRRAEEAAAKAERWELAATAAGRRGDLERDQTGQSRLRATEADYHLRAGDASTALLRLEQAHELAPRDLELADRLERTYEQEGRLDEIAAFIVRRAEQASDNAESVALLKRAAVFRRDRLNDPDGSRDLLLRVVGSTEDFDALSLLADDAAAREEHQNAIDYLKRIEPILKDRGDKIRVALRQASLLADGVGDVDAAVARYQSVLESLDENCREALQAIADLEQARERFPQAADALERDLELAQPGDEKATIARRLGEIYIDQTRELGKSLAAFETVVREDPEDFAALQKLRELCERAEKWPRVLELLDNQIEVEGDDDEIASLTSRKAEILADNMNQVGDALRTLAPLTMAGSDVARSAAMAIADRHKADAQIGGQILAWARTTPGSEGQRLLGEAFDRFVNGGAADRALEIAPDVLRTPRGKDQDFLKVVEPLAIEARATELVLEIHDRRGAGVSGTARAAELIRQARVRIDLGVDRREAIEHGELGLAAVPAAEAGELLEQLAELAPDSMTAVELLERHVGRCKNPVDRLHALVRAYRRAILSDGLDEKTKELAESALGIASPEDPLDALWNAARAADELDGESHRRRALIDVLIGTTSGPRDGGRTRSSQLRRVAERMRTEIGDEDASYELLARALVAHVDASTLDAVEEATAGEPQRAESIYTRALEDVFDGPLVRQIISRRATLRQEKLNDFDGAIRDLKKLHELAPADTQVTDRYRSILTEANDYRGMIQLNEDGILRSKDQNARADLARNIAKIWEERLGDARESADAWRRVLRLKPQDAEATAGLDRAKRNKLQFEEGKYPVQRIVAEGSIAPPPKLADRKSFSAPRSSPPRQSVPPMSSAPPTDVHAGNGPGEEEHVDEVGYAEAEETMTATPSIALEHEPERTVPEDEINTGVGSRSSKMRTVELLDAPDHTSEIAYSAAATDAYPIAGPIDENDDLDDMPTMIGDSAELALKDMRKLHQRQQETTLTSSTDEVPAVQMPKAPLDPDASAELIADDEFEEVLDDDELLEDK